MWFAQSSFDGGSVGVVVGAKVAESGERIRKRRTLPLRPRSVARDSTAVHPR
jgi:acetyl-CoA carboxylase beta subunit